MVLVTGPGLRVQSGLGSDGVGRVTTQRATTASRHDDQKDEEGERVSRGGGGHSDADGDQKATSSGGAAHLRPVSFDLVLEGGGES